MTVQYAAPVDTPATQFVHLRLREHSRRWGRKILSARGSRNLQWERVSWKWQGLLPSYLNNMAALAKTSDNSSRPSNGEEGKLSPRHRNTGRGVTLREWGKLSSSGLCHLACYAIPKGRAEIIHTQEILTDWACCIYIFRHIYACMCTLRKKTPWFLRGARKVHGKDGAQEREAIVNNYSSNLESSMLRVHQLDVYYLLVSGGFQIVPEELGERYPKTGNHPYSFKIPLVSVMRGGG